MKKTLALALAFFLFAAMGMLSATGGYAEACASDSNCQGGLKCINLLCNQPISPTALCDPYPIAFVPSSSAIAPSANESGVESEILKLENGTGIIGGSSNIYKQGWFSNWGLAGLIAVGISIAIVSIAAMFGRAFDLPEIKAFANEELVQAVYSVMLVGGLVAAVGFFDILSSEAVNSGGLPVSCNSGEPCYITAAKQYLSNVYDLANEKTKNALAESYNRQKRAALSTGVQAQIYQLAFMGMSLRQNAFMSIEAERAGAIYESVSKLMVSIYAQRYFIDVIAFGIAPVFLLFGIILRTFFFTRKLGGLMIAIAISLFIVYPLTFALAWYTLNVTVYGERTFSASDPTCPAECGVKYPVAIYSRSGRLYGFESTQHLISAGITDANWNTGGPGASYGGLIACRDLSAAGITKGWTKLSEDSYYGFTGIYLGYDIGAKKIAVVGNAWKKNELAGYKVVRGGNVAEGLNITNNSNRTILGLDYDVITVSSAISNWDTIGESFHIYVPPSDGCPDYCRDVPFPSNIPECNITKCAAVNPGCKIMRQRTDCDTSSAVCGNSKCSIKTCRTQAPVENKCYSDYSSGSRQVVPADLSVDCSGCEGCPAWCKVLYRNTSGGIELKYSDATCNRVSCKPPEYSGTCPVSCMYIAKSRADITTCEELCTVGGVTCPLKCRINNITDTNSILAPYDGLSDSQSKLIDECASSLNRAACSACPPACKVEVPIPPLSSCAPYPVGSTSTKNCTMCPEFCRFTSFVNYNETANSATQFSNMSTEDTSDDIPEICALGYGTSTTEFKCDPANCATNCKNQGGPAAPYPHLCRAYNASGISAEYCQKCPEMARVSFTYNGAPVSPILRNTVPTMPADPTNCTDPSLCGASCKSSYVIPGPDQYCDDYAPNTYYTIPAHYAPPAVACTGLASNGFDHICNMTVYESVDTIGSCSATEYPCVEAHSLNPFTYTVCTNTVNTYMDMDAPCEDANNPDCVESYDGGIPVPCGTNNVEGFTTYTPCDAGTDGCMEYNTPDPDDQSTWSEVGVCTQNFGEDMEVECHSTTDPTCTQYNESATPPVQQCTDTTLPCTQILPGAPVPCYIVTITPPQTMQCYLLDHDVVPCYEIDYHPEQTGVPCTTSENMPTESHSACQELPWVEEQILPNYTKCKWCQTGCRIISTGYSGFLLNTTPICNSTVCGTSVCSNRCKANMTAPVCSEYLGFGPGADPLSRNISGRPAPYNNVQGCRQCPEHCRIIYANGTPYTGSCGIIASNPSLYVDCSVSSCPLSCRTTIPTPDTAACNVSQINPLKPYFGCPAMCRRDSSIGNILSTDLCNDKLAFNETGALHEISFCGASSYGVGGTSSCALSNPAERMCVDCATCPSDCTYTPSTRTDCYEVCNDEALAGPVNIGPSDFIAKLPGAEGRSDAKSAGVLLIPALVLPLFGIVIVLSFIRVFSPILGGDVDIPGIGKII